jgi:hypothetical protein
MSDRTKLTLASLTVMMLLPYRIDFLVTVLVLTAAMCMAIDTAREACGRIQLSRNFTTALSVYHSLKCRTMNAVLR